MTLSLPSATSTPANTTARPDRLVPQGHRVLNLPRGAQQTPCAQAGEQLLHLSATTPPVHAAGTQHLQLCLLPTAFSCFFQLFPLSPGHRNEALPKAVLSLQGHRPPQSRTQSFSRQLLTLLCRDLPLYPGRRQLSMGRLHQTPL